MTEIIKPRPISGFPEWLPNEKILEEKMLGIIRRTFERFGFCPLETPAVERNEVLTSKGGNEKEIYSLTRLAGGAEDDAKDFSLHFDLTVPLARYVAQHYNDLIFPFRRYQIQKVWRGERPQDGRFREFTQCDIDIIGEENLSLLADAEIPSIIYQIFRALEIGDFLIRVNNRKLLSGFLLHHAISPESHNEILRSLDKVEKIGREKVERELTSELGLSEGCAREVLDLTGLTGTTEEILNQLASREYGEVFALGVAELREVTENMEALGVPASAYKIDLGVARGLDYYTGTVYETNLTAHPGIGSVCSGGRFDNLAGNFIKKKLPGVGISIGLTRLFSRLLAAGVVKPGAATMSDILVTVMDRAYLKDYLTLATRLRGMGLRTEVYTEPKAFKKQMQFASRKGVRFVLIAGENEFKDGKVKIKNMESGEETEIAVNALEERVPPLIAG